MIATQRALLEGTPADDDVRVGIAPEDSSWYLRFRAEWDETDTHLQGHFDVTVPDSLVERFRWEVLPLLPIPVLESDAREYYESITQ